VDSNYAKAWYNKGIALYNLRKYDEAIASYDEAIRVDSNYAKAWYNKGLALDNIGKHEEAKKSYDKAKHLN
jgi:superkiller protein 3